MKNFVLVTTLWVGIMMPNASIAHPLSFSNYLVPVPELQIPPLAAEEFIGYSPIWIVDDESKNKLKKLIWLSTEDGSLVALEASSSAILRLAWSMDTYNHEKTTKSKTKTN